MQGLGATGLRGRPQSLRLAAEIGENRVRLRERQIAIHQNRHASKRVFRQKGRLPVFSFYQIDRHEFAVEPQLLKCEGDLLRIGRRKMVELHRYLLVPGIIGSKSAPSGDGVVGECAQSPFCPTPPTTISLSEAVFPSPT